jgi:hypothetical protein
MSQLSMLDDDSRNHSPNPRIEKLLNQVDVAWKEFIASWADLSDADLLLPGVTGDWSIRDLVAHVTWWDREAIDHLPLILSGGRPPKYSDKYGGIDAFNAQMTEKKRDLSLDQVRQEFESTHARLIDYILSVAPEDILAEPRFRRRLKLDTFGHYPIHTADILSWRSRNGLEAGQ